MSGFNKRLKVDGHHNPVMLPHNPTISNGGATMFHMGNLENPAVDVVYLVPPIPGKSWTHEIPLHSFAMIKKKKSEESFVNDFYTEPLRETELIDITHCNALIAEEFIRKANKRYDTHKMDERTKGEELSFMECFDARETLNEINNTWVLAGLTLTSPPTTLKDMSPDQHSPDLIRAITVLLRSENTPSNYWSRGIHGSDHAFFVLKFVPVDQRNLGFTFSQGSWIGVDRFHIPTNEMWIPQYVAISGKENFLPVEHITFKFDDKKRSLFGKVKYCGQVVLNPDYESLEDLFAGWQIPVNNQIDVESRGKLFMNLFI